MSGNTGCGKSTQVPQLILDDALMNSNGADTCVLVTEPRRISATSLAARVADERAEKLGDSVGYQVFVSKQVPLLHFRVLLFHRADRFGWKHCHHVRLVRSCSALMVLPCGACWVTRSCRESAI